MCKQRWTQCRTVLLPLRGLSCCLLQASFASEAQLQQHVAGPVHRKAEKKAAEEAAKRQHQSQYGSIAANALQAAAWQDSRSAQALRPDYGQQQQLRKHQQRQKEHQARARGGRQQQQQDSLTHEQVLASVKQADPLSLDGRVQSSNHHLQHDVHCTRAYVCYCNLKQR